MQTDTAYVQAKERVEQRLGLLVHVTVYLAVNVGLSIASGTVNLTSGRFWGWGIGVAVHALYVLTSTSGGVVDRMVAREAQRQR